MGFLGYPIFFYNGEVRGRIQPKGIEFERDKGLLSSNC
jgi:hypothetical protein